MLIHKWIGMRLLHELAPSLSTSHPHLTPDKTISGFVPVPERSQTRQREDCPIRAAVRSSGLSIILGHLSYDPDSLCDLGQAIVHTALLWARLWHPSLCSIVPSSSSRSIDFYGANQGLRYFSTWVKVSWSVPLYLIYRGATFSGLNPLFGWFVPHFVLKQKWMWFCQVSNGSCHLEDII